MSAADVARRAVAEQGLCAGDASGNADAARSAFERFPAAKVACVSHMWNAVENKGTSMRPTKRSGWLVAVAG